MPDLFAFRCQREGLGSSLRSGLLGGYSGSGSWSIFVEEIVDASEHMVVQVHEALHHELQVSTIWGQISALSALLAERGRRPLALYEVFDHGVAGSTLVHEAYATYLSDRTLADRAGRDVLAGNPEYAGYRRRADALLPQYPEIDPDVRTAAVAAILRSLMQPAGLIPLVEALDFEHLRASGVRREIPDGPDRRLRLLEAANRHDGWLELLLRLSAANPKQQRDILAERRPTSPDDLPQLEEQWSFEVQVVQRRCHEFVSDLLSPLGSPCLPWELLRELAETVRQRAMSAEPAFGEWADCVRRTGRRWGSRGHDGRIEMCIGTPSTR